jgi:hypothetical protein
MSLFKGDLLDPFDDLHIFFEINPIHGMVLSTGDPIDGRAVMDEVF